MLVMGEGGWPEVVARVRDVAETCVARDLKRLRIAEDGLEIEVRRSIRHAPEPGGAPGTVAASSESAPSLNGSVEPTTLPDLVSADVVGIVRLTRPGVSEGTVLTQSRELAAIESLGIRNPITSRGSGTIVGVFVDDGQPVDYGQPLFAIRRD